MIPDTSTVGSVAAAVSVGMLSRDEAAQILTDAGFTDADGILRDLCGVERPR